MLPDTEKITAAMSTLTLKIRSDPGTYVRPRKGLLDFMQFPPEIRSLIYEFALVEPKRHDIDHKPSCMIRRYATRHNLFHPPPFLLQNVSISSDPPRLVTERLANDLCNCNKRAGMALLQTGRQVHAEAAPIFWSQNSFCFLSGYEAITALNHLLRPQYRDLVTSVSVMGPNFQGRPQHVQFADGTEHGPVPWSEFWEAVSKCRNLNAVNVPTVALQFPTRFHQLAMQRSTLRVKLIDLIPFAKGPGFGASYSYDLENLYTHFFSIYAQATYRVPSVGELRNAGTEIDSDFWWARGNESCHLISTIRETIEDTCLDLSTYTVEYSDSDTDASDEPYFYDAYAFRILPIIEDEKKRFLRLETGKDTFSSVKFYGLPTSRKERVRFARERRAENEEYKRLNGMYRQHSFDKEGCRRARKLREEQLDEETAAALKAYNKASSALTPATLQKQEKKKALKEKKKSMKDNAENRRRERKRVQN
ncbi:hypothetical protein CORC01_02943 [Colletotrichum orchidophilum]|uniref:DUF7730 domain-containing protein n=1 Tax=Colletotrichum orchidophilum TaxID=1209926 RepID=A0A1G4BJY2_9PEZI|nr:uncharacterized protein CORC01_02943 [Colletotrichum orchidophilum]OHF01752.1 hypothetical protein CORC01_02943 [Colletotrichum orchidophilum]